MVTQLPAAVPRQTGRRRATSLLLREQAHLAGSEDGFTPLRWTPPKTVSGLTTVQKLRARGSPSPASERCCQPRHATRLLPALDAWACGLVGP